MVLIINTIIKYFIGVIKFKVTNGISERLINLCSDNNIKIWGFEKTDEGFNAYVTANQFKYVVEYARKCNIDIDIVEKKGFCFNLYKYKLRFGLFLGFVLSVIFIVYMQNIAYEIEIIGNDKVSDKVILNELENLGIHKNALITTMDFQYAKQVIVLNIPQLSWASINRDGNKITVLISERHIPPILEESYPCDIVASRTGLILYMEVYAGETLVEVNNTVLEGQKLVSGILESERLDIVNKVHSNAKIIAQVQFDKTLAIDLNQYLKEYTGETKARRYFTLFDIFEIPLFISGKDTNLYDVNTCHEYFEFFTLKLPIGIKTSTLYYYNEDAGKLSIDKAEEILNENFKIYEQTELSDFAILNRNVTNWVEDDVLYVKIDYIAEENIAKKIAIIDHNI